MNYIIIQLAEHQIEAELFDTPTGDAILEVLPFESSAHTWGDEIYFHVPADAALEPGAGAEVSTGDLAYWPAMPAFCIFFGPTPASISGQPRAAGPVNVFGRLIHVDLTALQSIRDGDRIRVEIKKKD